MKNEQLKELAAVLNGIADGWEWQFEGGSHLAEPTWFDASPKDSPLTLLGNMGRKIRLKPDPFEPFRQALRDGKTVECLSISNGWLRWLGGEDFGGRKAENFRIKPELQKVPLEPKDVPPLTAFKHKDGANDVWCMPSEVTTYGVTFWSLSPPSDGAHLHRSWFKMMDYVMKRPTDTGWQPCWKEVAP